MGRSKGDFTITIDALIDALGNPSIFIRLSEQRNALTQALRLIEGIPVQKVVADRGYDSNKLMDYIQTIERASSYPFQTPLEKSSIF